MTNTDELMTIIFNDDASDLSIDYNKLEQDAMSVDEWSDEDMTFDMIDNAAFVDSSWFINVTGADLMDSLETVCALAGKRIVSITLEDDA